MAQVPTERKCQVDATHVLSRRHQSTWSQRVQISEGQTMLVTRSQRRPTSLLVASQEALGTVVRQNTSARLRRSAKTEN